MSAFDLSPPGLPAVSLPSLPPLPNHPQTKHTTQEVEVAHQFEALLIQQWLKQVRQSSENTLFDSDQTRFVQSWSDEALALQLSTPGMGLAQALLEQMGHTKAP